MQNLIINLIVPIISKLVDKFLTPENIEKYSDKLFDLCRKGLEKIEDEHIRELLLDIVNILDENIGE